MKNITKIAFIILLMGTFQQTLLASAEPVKYDLDELEKSEHLPKELKEALQEIDDSFPIQQTRIIEDQAKARLEWFKQATSFSEQQSACESNPEYRKWMEQAKSFTCQASATGSRDIKHNATISLQKGASGGMKYAVTISSQESVQVPELFTEENIMEKKNHEIQCLDIALFNHKHATVQQTLTRLTSEKNSLKNSHEIAAIQKLCQAYELERSTWWRWE